MPRAKGADAPEPKRRSRNGCWPCKNRKIKCGEEKPQCVNCVKQGEACDYSIRLQWGGRSKKDQEAFAARAVTPSTFVSSPAWISSVPTTPAQTPVLPSSTSVFSTSFVSAASKSAVVANSPRALPPTASSPEISSLIDPRLMSSSQSSGYDAVCRGQGSQQKRLRDTYQPPTSQEVYPSPYPVPTYSASPGIPHYTDSRVLSYPLPPLDFAWSDQHKAKRLKRSSLSNLHSTLPQVLPRLDLLDSNTRDTFRHDRASPVSTTFTPVSADTNTDTSNVSASSLAFDESSSRLASDTTTVSTRQSPQLGRFSVDSLLSGPPGNYENKGPREKEVSRYPMTDVDGSIIYGYDYGRPDLDLSRNNDSAAIVPRSPDPIGSGRTSTAASPVDAASVASPAAFSKHAAFQRGGYYAQPVPIKIPRELEPLPSHITNDPMNLLYFHHFLNHTARVLTPHDCPDNPLRTTLPKMAMSNPDLLNLLFAYSASHRARLLSHPEPKDRIAYWVRDVFGNLRHALSSPEPVTDATLATAIMLASREIITPNTFEVDIPWQNHLGIARQVIIQRGGLKDMGDHGSPIVNFLARWFAYLDVIGSLSGHKNDVPLSEAYLSFPQDTLSQQRMSSTEGDSHGFAIDCFFGFTNCCISLLSRVAKLAHECDKERIDSDGNIDPDWEPSAEKKKVAERLVKDLNESQEHVYAGCRHSEHANLDKWEVVSDSKKLDLQEIVSVNEAFHLAGQIHVYKRVLKKQSLDDEVQTCVIKVLKVLSTVREGGSADSCMLFPIFTAGCDAVDVEHRESILERLKLVEGLGMTHVQKARTLMQKSWDTGRPWETLASGEFFG